MTPHYCPGNAKKHGKDRNGIQRYRCRVCGATFLDEQEPNALDEMRIPQEKAIMALKLLAESASIRAVERLTGLHRDTVCKLLVTVGQNVNRYMEMRVANVTCTDVQADEIWTYCQMKDKTKKRNKIDDPWIGSQYCFIGIERHSKLVLAWQFAYYNFCWVHGSLRVTPAMESKLTDHVWTVEELFQAATQC